MYQNRTPDKRPLAQEIEARFGVMPNFFCTASAAPGLIDELWTFAKSAYLDSPLPSLFKERLFVYLSRFCVVRYCIVRHVGFLIGEGRSAGDAEALPETIEQVIALLTRPAPDAQSLEEAVARLEALTGPTDIPAPRTELEWDLFDALTIIFLEPRLSERARNAVRCAFGEPTFEILAAYLAFIRTAHYWTETHPELAYEPDMAAVMQRHPDLAALLLDQTEAKRLAEGEALRQALAELTQAKQVVAERNTQLELASKSARVGSLAIDFPTGLVKLSPGCAAIIGLPEGTVEMSINDANKFVHPEDLVSLKLRRDQALLKQQREIVAQFRIRRADDGAVRWIEAHSHILYDQGGKPAQLIGVRIDVTNRKLAADMLAERNLQLELAGKVGRVGSYSYDVSAEKLQVSEGYAALHGLPEGTSETTLSEWRARVHPEDLGRVESVHDQALADKRGEYSVEYRIVRSDGEMRWTERRCLISYDGGARPQRVVGVSIDVTERKQAEKHRDVLNSELDHRVKNVLATVCAIILQTQRAKAPAEDFVASVDRRIKSLASTHELLSHSRWHGVPLADIIRREFAPYTTGNTEISGPSITLKPEAAQATAMVLHELVTNAAKYGALSNHSGRVSVRWFWLPNETPHHRLAIEWQESGGPPVLTPNASGYGTSIIRELIPYELGGTVDLAFAPGGVRCRLEVPARCVSGAHHSVRRAPATSTPFQ